MRLQYFSFLLLFGLFFSACSTEKNTIPESLEPQKEAIVLEGMLSAKPLSIFEEGTHIITDNKGKTRILQSSITDLSQYEGHLVKVTGEAFVASEQKAVEVFVVQEIIPPPEKRMTRFPEQEFSFVATLPSSFERQEMENGILYQNPQSGAKINVSFLSKTPKTQQKWQREMQNGTKIKVAGKDAVRILRENGNIDIFIPLSERKEILLFSFSEGKSVIPEKTTFYEMLLRLEWISPQEQEEENILETENTPNIVCGGLAKKLCPSGYRCEFLSWEKNAEGKCIDATLPPQLVQKELSRLHRKEDSDDKVVSEEKKPLPEKFTEYENKRMNYSFSIPSSWHWRHIGAQDGSISLLEIGEEEVSEKNTLIEIRIENGIQKKRQIKKTGRNVSLLIPRDSDTHYRISGLSEWQELVKKIGDSIQPLIQE